MSTNMPVSSSSFDDLPLPPHFFSNSSFHPLFKCFRSRTAVYVLSTISISGFLLLPFSILVLYLGYQQWRKRRSSHSDIITYHSITMQLYDFLGFIIFFCGGYINHHKMLLVGMNISSVTSLGQALFHLLTCVERYLAVVHPVTYLGLRQTVGGRIRNISIGCVWFLSSAWELVWYLTHSLILYYCVMGFFVAVVSFCSISVLCALKRPRPGEVGGNKADKSKQRAFHTITAVMGVLLFRFGGDIFTNVLFISSDLSPRDVCVVMMSAFWFSQPSSWVLPLLFLHRAGKLQCYKQNSESR